MYIKRIIPFLMSCICAACGVQSTSTSSTAITTPLATTQALSSGVAQFVGTPTPELLPTHTSTPEMTSITGTKIPSEKYSFPTFERVYAWMAVSLQSSRYGFFNPNEDHQGGWNYLEPSNEMLRSKLGPGRSVSLAFSNFSDRLAYVVWNESAELWLSDVELSNPERVWIDETGWLGTISGFTDIRVVWGIADRYVVLYPTMFSDHIVIYDVEKSMVKFWLGGCNNLARGLVSQDYVIWCDSNDKSGSKTYLVLEREELEETDREPSIISKTMDWVYSSDGKSLLYATENLDIFTISGNSNQLRFSAEYASPDLFDIMIRKNLQWSQDGNKILVYAYGEPRDLCPQWNWDAGKKRYEESPCWLVFDANTGNVIWKPDSRNIPLGLPWESWAIVHGATLSNDGKWLAMVLPDFRSGRHYILYISSVEDYRTTTVAAEEAIYLKWISDSQ
jgi:hypothetical protein